MDALLLLYIDEYNKNMEINGNKKYKVIFFDWNKTLSNSLFWEQLGDSNHERHEWNKNISTYLFRDNKHLISNWMRGEMNDREIVNHISFQFNYSPEALLDELATSCRNMKFVSDEVIALIDKLRKKGTRCVIATDNMDTFRKYTIPALELEKYFDDILVSFDNGIFKFDTQDTKIPFFDGYLKEHNLRYEDVVLIDDCVDASGVYNKLNFDILQVFNSDDFIFKLKHLAH